MCGDGAAGQQGRHVVDCLSGPRRRIRLGDHLAVICRRAEQFRLERQNHFRLNTNGCAKILDRNLRPLGHTGHVDDQAWRVVVRTRRFQLVYIVLAVPQRGEVRLADDDDFIGRNQCTLNPAAPHMRQIEYQERYIPANHFDHGDIGLVRNVHDLADRGRGREQGKPVAGLRQQAFNHCIVCPLRLQQGIGNGLCRLLIEVECRRAKGQVEVDKGRVDLGILGKRPGQIVRNGRGPYPALGADH